MLFIQDQKTQLLHTDIYDLYYRKEGYEAELDIYKDIVTVFDDFSLPSRRVNGGLYYAKQLVPIFFGFTLLILILIANRKKITDTFNKY